MNLKEELVQEMEITRQDFHHLLDSVPEALYHHPSDNPAWTIGEVLYHMSLAPRFMTADLRMLIGQAWAAKFIGIFIPKSVFDKLNEHFTRRWSAQNMTREKLSRAYDNAHKKTLHALERLNEDDLGKSVKYPDYDELLSDVVSVEKLFHYIKIHFDSHAEQIRQVVKEYNEQTSAD